jgi:hypothetical protein
MIYDIIEVVLKTGLHTLFPIGSAKRLPLTSLPPILISKSEDEPSLSRVRNCQTDSLALTEMKRILAHLLELATTTC